MPQIRYIPLCTPVPSGGCDVHGPACPTPGKRPLQSDWAHQWSLERPETGNAGVLCGPEAGLLVIDVDTQESELQYVKWSLPVTYTVKSGRKGFGYHYYYLWPAGLERVPNRLDGVEIKGAGRQVVAPDSLHGSGNRYRSLGGEFVELPEAFVARLRDACSQHTMNGTVAASPEAKQLLEDWLDEFAGAEEQGDGNWVMCCPAHDDHDPSLVVAATEGRLLVHCRAGCPVSEVCEAIGWPVARLWAPPEVQLFTLADVVTWRVIKPALPTRITMAGLMGMALAPVAWAVPGMVPEGLTLLAGPPKLGKSWFVLDLAIRAAAGEPFLGRMVPEGDVLYLALEDNLRRLQGRARILHAGSPASDRLELWTRAGKLASTLIPQLEDWLDQQECPRLVVIDTLGRVQEHSAWAGDASDGGYAEAIDALAGLQDMACARGVAVILVTHTKKGGWAAGADPLEAVLGSQGYAGTADSILVMGRGRGDEDGKLFITGREITEEATLAITFDPELCRWLDGKADLSLSDEILNLLDDQPYKLTKNQIVKAVERHKADVLACMDALEAAGLVAGVPSKRRGGGNVYGPPAPGA